MLDVGSFICELGILIFELLSGSQNYLLDASEEFVNRAYISEISFNNYFGLLALALNPIGLM
jgi:hypothetical protein